MKEHVSVAVARPRSVPTPQRSSGEGAGDERTSDLPGATQQVFLAGRAGESLRYLQPP